MKSINILIIEDETLIAMQIENRLEQMGHRVLYNVKSSDEVFAIDSLNNIDLIISDINIEGDLDGITTSRIIHERYKIPVIFITAYKDIETLKKASLVDYAGYVMKPFREDELEALINLTILKYNLPKSVQKVQINENYSYCNMEDSLFYKEEQVTLTKKEKKFLQLLINANGELIDYTTIEQNIWYDEIVTSDTRRKLINRLQKKIPDFPLELKKGVGYKITHQIY